MYRGTAHSTSTALAPQAPPLTEATLASAFDVEIFRALSDQGRVDVFLNVVANESRSVTAIGESLGISVADSSRRLIILERAGLVEKKTLGRETFYSATPAVVSRFSSLVEVIKVLERDRS